MALLGLGGDIPPEKPPEGDKDDFLLKQRSLDELLALRRRIEEYLPARSLAEINLEEELVLQYQQVKTLLDDVLKDGSETPANQRAQVVNSCSALLGQLAKLQTQMYTSERLKAIEAALVRALKSIPTEAAEKFFVEYERMYREKA